MKSHWTTDLALLVLRIIAGGVALYYGSQKLLGAFGGQGFHSTIVAFQKGMGIEPVFGALAIASEFAGGLGIVSGFLTRIAAFGFMVTMAVATVENWLTPNLIRHVFTRPDASEPPRMFFSLMLFGAAFAIMLIGPGRFSLDEVLLGGKGRKKGKR